MVDKIRDFVTGNEVAAGPEEVDAVQPYSRRLVEDFGYPKSHIMTHPQHRVSRSPSDEARSYPVDIAVFADASKKVDDLLMIVECKQKKRTDGIKELKRYLDLCPANVGVWYNGLEHCYLRKFVNDKGINDYQEIPTIPFHGQRLEDLGKFVRKDLKSTLNLRPIFKDLRNYIAGNATGVTRDETIAAEIINILFCKIYDEVNTGPNEQVEFRHGINETPDVVAARLRSLFEKVKAEYSDVFDTSDRMKLDDKSISYVVGELQPFCITNVERDAVGDAFEVFIGPALKGSQGQFFTPRNIVRTAVQMIDPGPDDVILDPACGSGGFLIVALEHVWQKLASEAKKRRLGGEWLDQKKTNVAQRNFRGIEKDAFLAKITKAYMAIVGDGRGGIFCENSLYAAKAWTSHATTDIPDKAFDVILTNPPFGAKITVSDHEILSRLDLGHKWKRDRTTKKWSRTATVLQKQAPQVLFIERCYEFLKPGGRLAIVLPDGVLGGAKIGYVPSYIADKFNIVASIDCPVESFSPNTTTKVHLLILQKKDKKSSRGDVYMSVPRVIGHDKKGQPIYIRGTTDIWDDLTETVKNWQLFKKKKLKDSRLGFMIKHAELEESINAKRYLPEFMQVHRTLHSTSRTTIKIKDIAKKLSTGANVDNLDYVDGSNDGIPYVLVKNVLEEGITFSNLKYIRKSMKSDVKSSILNKGDIVINRCGDAGVSIVVPEDYEGSVACGFCFILRLKDDYDPYYVAAFLNSVLGMKQLKRLALGSILEHITKEDLERVLIVFPDDPNVTKLVAKQCKNAVSHRLKARKEHEKFQSAFEDLLAKL